MRETGAVVDKIVLTTDPLYVPTGFGPPESPQNGLPTVETPVITPAGGSYIYSVDVSLLTGTVGATIYYTLDGNTPTTGSTVYSVPFTLVNDTTVKAYAVLSGYNDSAVASAVYTITTAATAQKTATVCAQAGMPSTQDSGPCPAS